MLAPAAVWMFAWAASQTSTDPAMRLSTVVVGATWFMITAAGLASMVIVVAIPLGWVVATVLVAVAALGSVVSLAPLRHTPGVLEADERMCYRRRWKPGIPAGK
jgi:heme A synthase